MIPATDRGTPDAIRTGLARLFTSMRDKGNDMQQVQKSKGVERSTPAKTTTTIDPELRTTQISTAAYYKAEARGFAPGHELEDWLEAERELDIGAATRLN